MASLQDVTTSKIVKMEFNRRQIDTTHAEIKVFSGIVYISGKIKPFTSLIDAHETLKCIKRNLRGRQEIRDVILDVGYLN